MPTLEERLLLLETRARRAARDMVFELARTEFSSAEFQAALAYVVRHGWVTEREIADELGFSYSAVTRWRAGTSAPVAALQKLVLGFLAGRMTRRAEIIGRTGE